MNSDDSSPSRLTARVLPFRPGRPMAPPRRGDAAPVANTDPAIVRDLAHYHHGDAPDDYRHRMIVNLVAFVFIIALACAGYWLADTMARMRKDQDCVLSGRRGCSPVHVAPQNRW